MTTSTAPLDLLRGTLARRPALPPLTPAAYARAHATYEAHSDQRALLATWLTGALDALLPGPAARTVLSVGPGDGSVDAPLARSLASGRGPLRWVVAEPDPVVGERCRARLAQAVGPAGRVVLHAGPFDTVGRAVGAEQVDVVLAVHSLYYVPDLAAAVAAAAARLAPGGSLVVLLAPLEALCLLTEAVDPASHRWWSGDLPAALAAAGLRGTTTRLPGQLDTTACFDPGSAAGGEVLDFVVGADCSALDRADRSVLLDALEAIETDGGPRRTVPHPVDAVVATRPSRW